MKRKESATTWSNVRKEIAKKFSKISEESLDTLNESWRSLSELVQTAYGLTKEKADSEIETLRQSIHEATAAPRPAPKKGSRKTASRQSVAASRSVSSKRRTAAHASH